MNLICIVRRSKSDFIGGRIQGKIFVDAVKDKLDASPITWQNISEDEISSDAIEEFTQHLMKFASARQIWVHNKSNL